MSPPVLKKTLWLGHVAAKVFQTNAVAFEGGFEGVLPKEKIVRRIAAPACPFSGDERT
jgi:hypothetical protein